MGRLIAVDGVKIKEGGPKYYNFVLHFLNIGTEYLQVSQKYSVGVDKKQVISSQRQWNISARLLFIALYSGSETVQVFADLIDKNLGSLVLNIEKLKPPFTFVTDCAATVPAFLSASLMPN